MHSSKIKLSDWSSKITCDFLQNEEIVRYYKVGKTVNIVSYIRPTHLKSPYKWVGVIWDEANQEAPNRVYHNDLDVLKFKVDLLLSEVGYIVSKLGS